MGKSEPKFKARIYQIPKKSVKMAFNSSKRPASLTINLAGSTLAFLLIDMAEGILRICSPDAISEPALRTRRCAGDIHIRDVCGTGLVPTADVARRH